MTDPEEPAQYSDIGSSFLHLRQNRAHLSPTILWALSGVYILMGILVILTNICVITAVTINRKLHQPVNYYVSSISAANFLMSFACAPMIALMFHGASITEELICNLRIVQQLSGDIVLFHSIYTMVVIALDRYRAVIQPEKRQYSRKQCMHIILLLWFSSILYGAPTAALLIYRKSTTTLIEEPNFYCYYTMVEIVTKYYVDLLIGYLVPLLLTAVLYGRIIRKLNVNRRTSLVKIRLTEGCWKKRSIKMSLGILTLFALCWLPIHIIRLATLSQGHVMNTKILLVRHLATILTFCNSWLYVVIYAYYNLDFRRVMATMLDCRWATFLKIDESASITSVSSSQAISPTYKNSLNNS